MQSIATRSAFFAATLLAAAYAGHVRADQQLAALGGPGGGAFTDHCPGNELLTGFELRTADDVDALRPLCVPGYGPHQVGAVSTGAWHGGTGGEPNQVVCPKDRPIVAAMNIGAEGVDTVIVNSILLYCDLVTDVGHRDSKQEWTADFRMVSFQAPSYERNRTDLYFHVFTGRDASRTGGSNACPPHQVAVGVHGRSGIWLDALGLICAEPRLDATHVKTLGRVVTDKPSAPHPAGWTICDSARDARSRNSPAAPNLEAQCARLPAKTLGRVPANIPTVPEPPKSICERARDARARNSPAAPNLEAQCRATG